MPEVLRADARRNRDAVVAAAREAMAEGGIEVSLRAVARQAGVGIGTLYRHFPSREALIQAAMAGRLDDLAERNRTAAAGSSPGEALIAGLERLVQGVRHYRGLPTAVLAATEDAESDWAVACSSYRDSLGALLAAAQATGEVRDDVTAADLFAAAAATGWVDETSGTETSNLLFRVLVDGLRPNTTGGGPRRAAGEEKRLHDSTGGSGAEGR